MPLPLNKKRANHRKGWWAEVMVAVILRCQGYKILARRFRCPVGEIDLIVSYGSWLIAVEVKKRPSLKLAMESLSMRQQKRICRALQWYQSRSKGLFKNYRFDLVVIYQGFRWRHLKNAWQSA